MGLNSEFVIVGHRGAAGLEPENTLQSFARAIALGVDAIELDVYCIDGALLVIHDDTLERTTNGTGPIAAKSLPQLRGLDAGKGQSIPLLEEVMDLVAGRVAVNVELKGKGTARRTAAVLAHYPGTESLVSSFDHVELRSFRATTRAIPVAPLFGRASTGMFEVADELRAWGVNLSRKIAAPGLLADARQRGYRTLVYTVNDPHEARALREGGASGVFTDFPDRISR
ncbi:MAG: glycerophosphodiester phosphodiesterase [Gammaproteobacteria bacterium]|nr:glycerophosphodiester phosphodiesterase [Gammaproteobacteria bacterium]